MDNVIKFDPREKILEKAKRYVDDEEVFLEEREQAVPLLLKALELGDETLKSEIIFAPGKLDLPRRKLPGPCTGFLWKWPLPKWTFSSSVSVPDS